MHGAEKVEMIKQVELIYGVDVIEGLKQLQSESVHCVVTSPPYWGLRSYGVDGQLGLEKTPEEFVLKMVEVFREVKRVLRKDGTLWLNLGDSYAGSGKGPTGVSGIGDQKKRQGFDSPKVVIPNGLKQKDLVGIPWRVALALQSDGWYLRSDIIWSKPNPMPESVTDRPTKAHEYIFLLTKSAKYFYDAEAIKEEGNSSEYDKHERKSGRMDGTKYLKDGKGQTKTGDSFGIGTAFRNKRTVWEITTQSYSGSHFATFPEAIPEICIKAGCPQLGVVLDPFSGSGTTGEVAVKLGRNYIGIDLNKKYEALAKKRIGLFACV